MCPDDPAKSAVALLGLEISQKPCVLEKSMQAKNQQLNLEL